MKIIFLGTASGAGKTTVSAMYCRYLARNGVSVAPFKASNLSLRSKEVAGGRIGIGQALQAEAAGIEPTADMNPVLLEPVGKGSIRMYLNGSPHSEMDDKNYMEAEYILEEACLAFDRLSEKYEAIVCEGSGSPAEINMKNRDIANKGMIRSRNIPAVLVGDIERGGVFAALYGTWKLMPDDIRKCLKGFVINRFRGDVSILDSGIRKIEEMTGMKFLGLLPYMKLELPEEDSPSCDDGTVADITESLDEMIGKAEESGFDFDGLNRIAKSYLSAGSNSHRRNFHPFF